ncbi:DUF6266 family protein [Pedobacter caeni]|uniref:Uncharacterized protein n=1 Tax=Pedobacter caeni TaxID=288992 RepID=A0A1M4VC48_9SPHI|nr:DUF6266 family protein [Pedobacter caeni]SHE66512.1 hypothetical protein SAMN04488522_101857 [Pedobacter caeni]
MAILTGGLFGNISGKIGGLVFSTRNNQTEVRNLPKKYEGPITEAALNIRARLKLLTAFLGLFTSFIRIGYPKRPKRRMSAFNAVFSKNYHCVIDGVYPNLEIDYSKVTFSRGNLEGLSSLKVDRIDRQSFDVKWNNSIKWGHYLDTDGCDRIYCILYDAVDRLVIEVSMGAMRNDNHFMFPLPKEMVGKKIHMYVFLRSSLKKEVSRTQYQCLDLREPGRNEKDRSLGSVCKTVVDDGVNAKKENLRKVAKYLAIPKKCYPKKKKSRKDWAIRS